MRYYQQQQYFMVQRTAAWLKKHREPLSKKVPLLADAIAGFADMYEQVFQLARGKKVTMVMGSSQKRSAKEGLINELVKLQSVLLAHSFASRHKGKRAETTDSGDEAIKTALAHSASVLRRMSAETLAKTSAQVIAAVKKVKYLSHYGLSEEDVRDAESYLKEFAVAKDAPVRGRSDTASRNKQLTIALEECITVLTQSIDPLMHLAAAGNLELSMSYKSLRAVLPRGQGRPSEKEAAYRASRKRRKRVV